MAQYFVIHAENPQARLLQQTVQLLANGGVIACPTDSSYALICLLEHKDAQSRIRRIRQVNEQHPFTLVCRDLSDISTYAKLNNRQFRLLKAYTPGPYTFLLEASRELPKRLHHPKRSTIGLRIPQHVVMQALLEAAQQPVLSMTLQLPEDTLPMSSGWLIREQLEHVLDAVIESEILHVGPTTVVDLTEDPPVLIRQGVANWP